MSTTVEAGKTGQVGSSKMDLLWGLAVVAGFGDLITTRVGLQLGLQEGNHLIVLLLDMAGWAGFTFFKIAILAGALLFAAKLSAEKRPAVPLGLASTWAVVTLLNAVHLAPLITASL